jgi:hypothetical protein
MITKNIQYLNKDFNSLKSKLINFAKSYYPKSYSDFSDNSPGMMLIEISAYVGDILSLYLDNQIQETFIQFSKQRKNLLSQAYIYGYFPKITDVSQTIIDIYQLLPAINISGSFIPDFDYSLIISEGCQLQSSTNSNIKFIIDNDIDFSKSSQSDPTEITIYSTNNNQEPDYYLLKKQRKIYSADIKELDVEIGNPERFKTIYINDKRIIKILEINDSDGNKWYEVPYLAQDIIYENILNNGEIKYKLLPKQISRRFISRFKSNNQLEIQFGAGDQNIVDEEIIPNSENVGIGLSYGINKLYTAYDPSNFLYTGTYGISPSNTTLNIKYLVGGGLESNVLSNNITKLNNAEINLKGDNLDTNISNIIINSLSFNNELPAIGGGDGDNNEILKQRILNSIPSQLRAVSIDDYIIRSLSLPSEYGNINKIHIDKNKNNSLDLFILSKDNNNNLINSNDIIKNNLSMYLDNYRSLTDSLNIKDAFIINIGVEFDIVIRPNYNNKLIINNCILKLIEYFNIDKWNINEPIILSEIYNLLDLIDGVQTVKNIKIINKYGEENGYSIYEYDIKSATLNNIIYPSLDPSIFELKYRTDIKGRSVSL